MCGVYSDSLKTKFNGMAVLRVHGRYLCRVVHIPR